MIHFMRSEIGFGFAQNEFSRHRFLQRYLRHVMYITCFIIHFSKGASLVHAYQIIRVM